MKKIIKLLTGKPAEDKSFAQNFYDELAVDVLARTLWGEGRGEGAAGMEAIASVILNRVEVAQKRGGYWWGKDIISVCQKPYQFSCWNRADPNYRKLQAITEKDIHYATAVRIARRAMAGTIADSTKGATHYHAKSILPDWAKGQMPTTTIGHHIFYKLIE
ncbi:MAG: cell wall hydrolase [Micavibrio aeruginosavorus]|uniref:Cell wall hydrolase n=1 Tax=Micavibrio aeruginosavorus TaxID=349221 RepID=A0A2W5N5E6_9BACT|nr:MAG: cell wall hydrolase [Micavibrio aeruginosavorus]